MRLLMTVRAVCSKKSNISNSLCTASLKSRLSLDNPHFQPKTSEWDSQILQGLQQSLKLLPNFISDTEENDLLKEVEPHLSRLIYEKDHWDEAIVDFRETERKHWNPANSLVIERLQQVAFDPNDKLLPYVHVLDLAEKGHIKPHIDSSRFCGDTVAVLSLLSDCVLKLVHDKCKDLSVSYFIPRRSLYVMKASSRYEFSHEILPNESGSEYGVVKKRRISIVCRNEAQ